jgi:hypothetical protein
MADNVERPADNLDAANLKAAEALRGKRTPSSVQTQQSAPQATLPPAAAPVIPASQKAPPWSPPDRTPDASASMASAPPGTVMLDLPGAAPLAEPIPAATVEERAKYEAALATVQELQQKVWQGQAPPSNVPVVQTLRKFRIRLEGVTVKTGKSNELTRYLRNLRKIIHPIHAHIVVLTPDGADVVDAYTPGEAWDKFKARFAIKKSEHTPMIAEMNSPEDLRAFELEKKGEISGDVTMSA